MEMGTTNTVSQPGKAKKGRRRGGLSNLINVLLLIGIIAVVALFVRAEMQRRETSSRLAQTQQQLEEARQATQRRGEEVAQEVLTKLRTHIDIPIDPAPTVATIVDIDRLKEVNEFYAPAKNGDHLVITERRAILYDAQRDIILDVVPVAISPDATPDPAATPGVSPAATDSPAPRTSPAATSPAPATTPAAP